MSNPLDTLHRNASSFFNRVQEKYPEDMQCRKGCDLCCHVDLSVFGVEAEKILMWFNCLSDNERIRLRGLWKKRQLEGASYGGFKQLPCPFLYDGACTIYEARPLICRTHGVPLKRMEGERQEVDCCSLNFENLPPCEDWIDQDRLNTLLSLCHSQRQGHFKAKENSEERLLLRSLKKILLQD